MGFLEDTDVQTILKDKTLVNELSEDAAKAPEVMSELAGMWQANSDSQGVNQR